MPLDGIAEPVRADSPSVDSSREGAHGPRFVILGGGPAGVGAAFRLAQRPGTQVSGLELRDEVGGNAGSFQLDGVTCDYGSHRLHPVVEPEVMSDLERLLGEDLLWRVRHGRILLRGHWIHFPLKPVDLATRLPGGFVFSIALDMVRKLAPRRPDQQETFASVLRQGLGRTMCEEFYFPYARKLWGIEPEELAATTARRRVSGSSLGKIIRKVAGQLPGLKSPRAGRFYYPRGGYGQISRRYAEEARRAGASIVLGARVTAVERRGDRVVAVRYLKEGREHRLEADAVWSSIPISLLVRAMSPEPPADVLEAARGLASRGMILIYLVLDRDRFSPVDAYYFPEAAIPITRMSEPKNFTGSDEPRGRTVLCAELPSDPGQPEWGLSDEELGHRLCRWLEGAGLPVRAPIRKVVTRRLAHAYPVYTRDYEARLATMDAWLGRLDGLLSFGRQGLFAHDNTHHALATAYAAARCLSEDGRFDRMLWERYRLAFESHVVED